VAIEGLAVIGESINDSVPSTQKLFEAGDIDGLRALAQAQDEGGAAYIDVNVGLRSPEFMAEMVRAIQGVTAKPLSIDTPDPDIAREGLEAYDADRAGGKIPILNSISPVRTEMLDLYAARPFRPVFMISERNEDGQSRPNRTGAEACEAARGLLATARSRGCDVPNGDVIFDPGIPPIGSDTHGLTKMVLDALKLIQDEPDLAGVHCSVGLSNFTVGLPPRRADGSLVKSTLESAFLTLAMPLGLDMVIGSVKRKYTTLPENHSALACLREVLALEGYDAIMRVMEFYS